MTLEQLRIFVAVAGREHVTQAARELNLTQSATSAAIAALEARYEIRLFDRVGRGIQLTEAGRMFLAEARAVLARAEAAERMLGEVAGLKRGTLNLAASQTAGNYWLPARLCRFHAAYPGIALRLTLGNTETVAASVREGAADLGFVEAPVAEADLVASVIAEDELVAVAAPPGPAEPDLARLPWVFRERGSGTRALLEAALTERGLRIADLNVVLELPSNEAVRAAVEGGAGIAVLSRLVVAASIRAGSLVALDPCLTKRRFYALHRRDRDPGAVERELLRVIA